MPFPTLYKVTKTGAIQTYEVSVTDDVITVTQGQLDGKKQSYTTTCTPKNEGRANVTTGAEQALSEAESKHTKKLKSGYVLDSSGTIQVKLPMKVKVYQDQLNNVKFPCVTQPKLNGVNATIHLQPDSSILVTSRGGEVYPSLPHLEADLHYTFAYYNTDKLAGELYIHGEHLQNITSAVKKANELTPQLTFHIFDFPKIPGVYSQRYPILNHNLKKTTTVFLIDTAIVSSHESIEKEFNEAISEGYEGLVIYNQHALYEYNTRSSNIFKYKKAQDAEFLIVGYEVDKNKHPILVCLANTTEIATFKVKPKGTDAERKQILTDIDTYLNKWYTVEFECYSATNIPLKPVGIGLRNCTTTGAPLE